MTFVSFAAARDMFYLGAALVGVALGFLLRAFRVRGDGRWRGAQVTLSMYLFSAAIFVMALALVFSRGAALYDGGLIRMVLCVIGVSALCVFFPIHVGFPMVILLGALIVWAGAVFWRFPTTPVPERSFQTAVRAGDLLPIIGGGVRYLPREPGAGVLFREEFAILSPAKHRLVFSFVANQGILSSL
jgi:hypothetical protein